VASPGARRTHAAANRASHVHGNARRARGARLAGRGDLDRGMGVRHYPPPRRADKPPQGSPARTATTRRAPSPTEEPSHPHGAHAAATSRPGEHRVIPAWLGWMVFAVLVLGMLALDLFVFHRRTHAVSMREALSWSGVWIGLALLFALGVWWVRGPHPALEFLTAYLIEESLSIDNLFVFLLLFAHFRVPSVYQHKVLFWGILGALAMRLIFIGAGVALLERFHAVIYLFGAVLVVSGVRMAMSEEAHVDPEKSTVLRLFRRFVPITSDYRKDKFFVRERGRSLATPLFVVLLMVETTDLVFAVDSIPAVLAISRDPFIVYTSNVFAIIGLRSLFFALARLLDLFHFLHYGLALILVFVGAKMILSHWIEVPIGVTLGVVGATILVSTVASIAFPRRTPRAPRP
jgi:tellurite resistance protein TerC